MLEPGWLHFPQTPAHDDPATGERSLSAAVVDDGVTIAVVKNGVPAACTIGWDDWDLLVHFVEDGRR